MEKPWSRVGEEAADIGEGERATLAGETRSAQARLVCLCLGAACRERQHALLDRLVHEEAMDEGLLLLTNAVDSSHRLGFKPGI